MAVLAAQALVKGGTAVTFSAAAGGGDSYANTGKEQLQVINGSGGALTVTLSAQAACNYAVSNTAHDIVKSVAAGAQVEFPAVDPKLYNDANGKVQITYSGVTTLTVAVVVASQF